MDESLSSLYAKADTLRRQIDEGTAQGDFQVCVMLMEPLTSKENVQTCIAQFERCKQLVDQLALFSDNEAIDDVASSELK